MDRPEDIVLKPIGIVKADVDDPEGMPIFGRRGGTIEIFPEYSRGLLRIQDSSHLWILMWFHKAQRDVLSTVPKRLNPHLPEYGVFGLRAFHRPNPIGLTLVTLEGVDGNTLHVSGLDAIDGTPVLDIKAYTEQDAVFSPGTPYLRPLERQMKVKIFMKQALRHHQEECPGLFLALRMALVAEEVFGQLNEPSLKVTVGGSPCVADTLQGLSRARLANPPRFWYEGTDGPDRSVWEKDGRRLEITARRSSARETAMTATDTQLFEIRCTESAEG